MFRTDRLSDADRRERDIETPTDRGPTDESKALLCVVRAVAAETDLDPLDMEPVFDALDTDTLARVVDRRREVGSTAADSPVRFRYESCDVTVRADGDVTASLRPDGTA
ncbi:hypothetical protein HZS55_10735 [Halosimplex rubrum]|uniref:Halobacterial output domain-containing protein n=1 Tax=Halosimplex rubrum TaxID=869889 RepID=A0A7D5SQJ6_9EURY|nr:HalOD1 output domain-containing protein [Halosimplex rubrum]QLH77747.1 hypothetical protein HZS55_10735 [Halosimplex rubrum]